MISVAMIHGIQASLPPDWWQDWLHELRRAGLVQDVQVTPIVWEWKRVRRGWLPDLLGNLTAVTSPRIQRHVRTHLDRAFWLAPRSIVVAHSLGTVLAHQALAYTELECDLLVTIGSPLWLADKYPSVFDRVERPAGVQRWVNFYSPWLDWVVGRRPIAAADLNIRCWSRHRALPYLRSRAFRSAMPDIFADVCGNRRPPAGSAIAA
jgi:predicted alpha/beta hydrolase family esterase